MSERINKPHIVQPSESEQIAADMQAERLGFDEDKAHTEALREYRSRDYDDYRSHVAKLADIESNSASVTGNYFTRLGKREDLKSDIKEYTEDKIDSVKAFGATAIHFATSVKAGLLPTLGNYRLAHEMDRGYKKNGIERPIKEKGNRALGKKALNLLDEIYTAGLERNDPTAAAEHKDAVRSKRQEEIEKAEAIKRMQEYELTAERKLAEEQAAAEERDKHIAEVMSHVDLSVNQNPRILELMNGRYYPDNVLSDKDNSATILYSRIFQENNKVDGGNYVVAYHTLDDGELLPLLLRSNKDNKWAIDTSLLPENLVKLLPNDDTFTRLIESISSNSSDRTLLNQGESEHLVDRLRLKPKSITKVDEPKSDFALRREQILKQKQAAKVKAEEESDWSNSRFEIARQAREQLKALRQQRELDEQKAA